MDPLDPNFFMTASTQKPEFPFECTITPREITEKNIPTRTTGCQLTWKDGVVYVLDRNGVALGNLSPESEAVYGDGIRYLEEQGLTVGCLSKLEVIGDKVYGDVGLRQDVNAFFNGKVPRKVLRARVDAEVARKQEEIQRSIRDARENEAEADEVVVEKKRGFLAQLFGK